MAVLDQKGLPLPLLLRVTTVLLSGADEPRAWNRALQALAASGPFFAGGAISVCRLDLEEGVREVVASYGPQAHELVRRGLSLAGLSGPATKLLSRLRQGRPLVIYEGRRLPEGASGLLGRLLPSPTAKPLVLLPLLSGGRVIGAFWVEGCDPGDRTRERMQMLRLLGNCLSLALAASTLHGEMEERDSALRAALADQERERERVALEVHDGPLQMLASAFQHLQAARHSRRQEEEAAGNGLGKASDLLRESMHELRALMESLRPFTLDRFGLMAAIESEVEELCRGGWQAKLVTDAIQLPKDRETALYRIVHEALANVRNHAGHCRVRVSLKRKGPWLGVGVRDWGRGFDPGALAQQGTTPGFGLLSMRKRAEWLGSKFEVESRPGAGTKIRLQVPLRRKGDWLPWSP